MGMDFARHPAINHFRFTIRFEPNVVQKKVHGSPESKVVQGARLNEML